MTEETTMGQGFNFVEDVPDQKKLKGELTYRVIKHFTDGTQRVIEEFTQKNLIVDLARVTMAHLVAGDVTNIVDGETKGRHITQIGFGTSDAEPELGDTTLEDPFMKDLDGHEYPEDGRVQFNWSLGRNEGNGTMIAEFGLFSEDGSLFARRRREDPETGEALPPIPKFADISLEGKWTIIY